MPRLIFKQARSIRSAKPGAPAARAVAMATVLSALAMASSFGTACAAEPAPSADFLFLGSYHMDNPGRDVHNTRADDVLAEKRQREIAEVVRLVERYRPTKVFVEVETTSQARIDGEYAASCAGKRPLERNEVEQLGYRIACDLGLPGVVAVDWNDLGPIRDEASIDFLAAIERHGQQAQRKEDMRLGEEVAARDQQVLDQGSVRDMLLRLNSPEWIEANARAYFRIGKYGTQSDPVGANWVTLWFARNLYIFNNIVRATAPGDRVLVLYGAGHGNWMRQLAADSGFYRLQDTQRWLREDDHDEETTP
jgi:hypothetical protein